MGVWVVLLLLWFRFWIVAGGTWWIWDFRFIWFSCGCFDFGIVACLVFAVILVLWFRDLELLVAMCEFAILGFWVMVGFLEVGF